MMAGVHFETEAVAAAVGSRSKISRRQETRAVAGSGRNCARMSGVEGRRQGGRCHCMGCFVILMAIGRQAA